jgi:hypothetical protein
MAAPTRTRGRSPGPHVVIKRPPVMDAADGPIIETVSPTDFIVFFEENCASVDMNSLQIEAKEWPVAISLTPRLRPYIQGTSLRAKAVEGPVDLFVFVIRIEIADVGAANTVGAYRLTARGQQSQGCSLSAFYTLRMAWSLPTADKASGNDHLTLC